MKRQLAETMDVKPVRITARQAGITYIVTVLITGVPTVLFDSYTSILPPVLASLVGIAVVNLALVLRKR